MTPGELDADCSRTRDGRCIAYRGPSNPPKLSYFPGCAFRAGTRKKQRKGEWEGNRERGDLSATSIAEEKTRPRSWRVSYSSDTMQPEQLRIYFLLYNFLVDGHAAD